MLGAPRRVGVAVDDVADLVGVFGAGAERVVVVGRGLAEATGAVRPRDDVGGTPVPRCVLLAASTRAIATITATNASEASQRTGWRIRQGSRRRVAPGRVRSTS